MLTRKMGYLYPREAPVPDASQTLQDEGWAVLRNVVSQATIDAVSAEIDQVYDKFPPDGRGASYKSPEVDMEFRYEMFNRSALCQELVGRREILDVVEPLLGDDCHIISNICWRNPPANYDNHRGVGWHIDAGPHIPRTPDQPWPDNLPYPIFAIGTHIYLQDCPPECGPTGVIPGSHKSGQVPPQDRRSDDDLTWNGTPVHVMTAKAGDVAMFVSDVWHRRMPSQPGDTGRFFLQVHYARRDIAQRLRIPEEVNQISPEARARIKDDREARLLGLHPSLFYDG